MPADDTIRIEFGYSTSPSYAHAVDLASEVGATESDGDGRSERHTVVLPAERVADAVRLWDLVGNWKATSMTVGGRPATKRDLTMGPLGNFQKRLESADPDSFCLASGNPREENRWGCRRLGLPDTSISPWTHCGAFNAEGLWEWDKPAIVDLLRPGIHDNRICPAFSEERVLAAVDALPDPLDPLTHSDWVVDWNPGRNIAEGVAPANQYNRRSRKDYVNVRPTQLPDGRYTLQSERRFTVQLREANREYRERMEAKLAYEQRMQAEQSASTPSKSSGCMVVLAGAIGTLGALTYTIVFP